MGLMDDDFFQPGPSFDSVEEARQYLRQLRESQGMNYLIDANKKKTSALKSWLDATGSVAPFALTLTGVFYAGIGYHDQNLLALIPIALILFTIMAVRVK